MFIEKVKNYISKKMRDLHGESLFYFGLTSVIFWNDI